MNVIKYSVDTIFKYKETTCVICFEDFSVDQRIIKIACEHVFHDDCFPEYYAACPVCFKATHNIPHHYNYAHLDQQIKELFANVYGMTRIFKRFDYTKLKVDILDGALQFYTQQIIDVVFPIAALKEINQAWTIPVKRSPQELEEVLNRHVAYLVKLCERHFQTMEIQLNHKLFLKDLEEASTYVKTYYDDLEIDEGLLDYIMGLLDKFAKHEKIKAMFKKHEAEFIRLNMEHMAPMNHFQRAKYLHQFDDTPRRILSAYQDLRPARVIRKTAVIIGLPFTVTMALFKS